MFLCDVNKYLKLSGDKVLTTPNAEARRRGKQASYTKWADRVARIEDIANEYIEDRKDFIDHNEDIGIRADIERWLKDNYTSEDTGYDYVKATPEEINGILDFALKSKENNEETAENNEEA